MKKVFALILSFFTLLIFAACGEIADNNFSQNEPSESSSIPRIKATPDDVSKLKVNSESNMTNISITVGGSVFSAKLYDNEAASALLAQFPLALDMSELNGNEKYAYLPGKLPVNPEQVGSIKAGDLMLYGSDCLVLFYESFSTSYSYTRLGYIEDTSDLATALGSGSAEVTLEWYNGLQKPAIPLGANGVFP